jgi:hypothetical protein
VNSKEGKSPALILAEEVSEVLVGHKAGDSLVALMTAVIEVAVHSVESADDAEDLINEYAERAADIARRRFTGQLGGKIESYHSVH